MKNKEKESNFEQIKKIILQKAKENGACQSEYRRALKSTNITEICQILKDNFNWGCCHGVITSEFIEQFKDDFAINEIFVNTNVVKGFVIASGSATVWASDSATVWASGSATVRAFDSATVWASDSATVRASGSATVRASGSATVRAFDSATVWASDSATVWAFGSATVRASGSAYVNCNTTIECKISDHAIIRRTDTNIIQFCDGTMKFEKI